MDGELKRRQNIFNRHQNARGNLEVGYYKPKFQSTLNCITRNWLCCCGLKDLKDCWVGDTITTFNKDQEEKDIHTLACQATKK